MEAFKKNNKIKEKQRSEASSKVKKGEKAQKKKHQFGTVLYLI